MRKIIKLFKMINKNNGMAGIYGNGQQGDDVSRKVLIVIATIAVMGGLGFVGYYFADIFMLLGGVPTILLLTGILTSMALLFLGVMSNINSLYMSTDIEVLITMPFSAMQIAVLRVMSFFRFALLIAVACNVPINVGYACVHSVTVKDWCMIVIDCVAIPVFVVAVVTVLVVLLMTFLKIFRNKDVLRYIGIVCLFILLCAYFFTINSEHIDMNAVIIKANNMANIVKYVVPVVGLSVDYLVTSSFIDIVLILACEVAAVALFYVVVRTFYLNGALSMTNTASGGKYLTDEDLDKYCQKKSVMKALRDKEYRSVRRNPTFTLNNFIVGFLWPILAIIVFKNAIPAMTNTDPGEAEQAVSEFARQMIQLMIESGLLLFITGLIPLIYSNIAYSSLTREGNDFPIMKQIPVEYKDQLEVKRSLAVRIGQFSTTLYVGLISIAMEIATGIPLYYAVIPTLLSFTFTEMYLNFDMYMGIRKAFVSWDDEKSAVKKNEPVVMLSSIVITFIVPIAVISSGVVLVSITKMPILVLVMAVIISAVMYAISKFLKNAIYKKGEKKIRTMRF